MNALGNLAMDQVSKEFEKTKAQMTTPKSKINWDDFNWPPFIRIAHFSLQELREPHFGIVKKYYWLLLLQVVHVIFNLINQIIQTAVGYSGLRILAWFLIMLIITSAAGYSFHNAYRAICDNKDYFFKHRIAAGLVLAIYLPMIIANTLNFDGAVRANRMFSDEHAFAGVMIIIEIIYIILLAAFQVYLIVLSSKWDKPPVDY